MDSLNYLNGNGNATPAIINNSGNENVNDKKKDLLSTLSSPPINNLAQYKSQNFDLNNNTPDSENSNLQDIDQAFNFLNNDMDGSLKNHFSDNEMIIDAYSKLFNPNKLALPELLDSNVDSYEYNAQFMLAPDARNMQHNYSSALKHQNNAFNDISGSDSMINTNTNNLFLNNTSFKLDDEYNGFHAISPPDSIKSSNNEDTNDNDNDNDNTNNINNPSANFEGTPESSMHEKRDTSEESISDDQDISQSRSSYSSHPENKRKDLSDSGLNSDLENGSDISSPSSSHAPANKKKPGRKMIMSEPVSKRKAQNRAAQRAFRERKERHLKDLETRVEELESEKNNTVVENQFLKKQIEKLQRELRDYREKASLSSINNNKSDLGNQNLFTFPYFNSTTNSNNQNDNVTNNPNSYLNSQKVESNLNSNSQPHNENANKNKSDMMSTKNNSPAQMQKQAPSTEATNQFSQIDYNGSFSTKPANNSIDSQSLIDKEESKTEKVFCDKLGEACGDCNAPISKYLLSTFNSSGQSPQLQMQNAELFDEKNVKLEPTLNIDKANLLNPGLARNSKQSNQSFSPTISSASSSTSFPSPSDMLLKKQSTTGSSPIEFSSKDSVVPSVFTGKLFNDYRDPIFNIGEPFFTFDSETNEELLDLDGDNLFNSAVEPNFSDNTQNNQQITPSLNYVPASSSIMHCQQLWDRICSHPQFEFFDVENLCMELKTKVKCSEAGVVVSEKDLDKTLNNFKTKS